MSDMDETLVDVSVYPIVKKLKDHMVGELVQRAVQCREEFQKFIMTTSLFQTLVPLYSATHPTRSVDQVLDLIMEDNRDERRKTIEILATKLVHRALMDVTADNIMAKLEPNKKEEDTVRDKSDGQKAG